MKTTYTATDYGPEKNNHYSTSYSNQNHNITPTNLGVLLSHQKLMAKYDGQRQRLLALLKERK